MKLKLLAIAALVSASFASTANALDVLPRGGGMCKAGYDFCVSNSGNVSGCRMLYDSAKSSGVWPAWPEGGKPAFTCFRNKVEKANYRK